MLCGRADLIEAAYANASPHQFIGRGLKVAKEEIIGLAKALEIFIDEDEEEENRKYQNMCDQVWEQMIASQPAIYLSNLGTPDELAVDPFNIADSELEIVIDRLQELLVQN